MKGETQGIMDGECPECVVAEMDALKRVAKAACALMDANMYDDKMRVREMWDEWEQLRRAVDALGDDYDDEGYDDED